jgi:type I restriction enzyme S subunit
VSDESLPPGWIKVPFADLLVKLANGTTVEQHKEPPGIPVSRIETISEAKINFAKVRYVRDASAEILERFLIQAGDILFSHINSDSHLGKCALYRGGPKLLHGMNLLLIRVAPVADPAFIERYLTYLRASGYFIQIAQHAVNQSSLNQKKITQIPIPLPPLAEQKRIVAKIEELFSELEAGEESLRAARRQLGVYRQSLLKQAFEGKLTETWRAKNPGKLESPEPCDIPADELEGFPALPKTWRYTRFAHFIRHIEAGKSFRCEERRPKPEEIGVAKVSAVTWGEYDEWESKTCIDPEKVNPGYFIRPGDFLLSRANTIELVGACVIARKVTQRVMLSDKTLRLDIDDALKPFFLQYLRSRQGRREIEKRSTGNQESMRNIGQDRIRSIIVPECPLLEQQEIVRLLDEQFEAIERNEREIDAALKRSEALRQAILKKAFTGQLVPQNPADEPASTLLARIRAESATTASSSKVRRGRSAKARIPITP